jgi:LPPG:FO 2-phospho-L-lactate transferase
VSIDPILAVPGVSSALEAGRRERGLNVVAISPIIGGKTVKGPAAKMFAELGITPSALAVAQHYGELCSGFVFDRLDEDLLPAVQRLGLRTLVTDTLMKSLADRVRLATEVLSFFGGGL